MPSPIRSVGIDLGTTLCSVAYVDDEGRTKMVPNALGEILTPSYVLFEDDAVIVGKEARKHAAILPDRVAYLVKRDMGQKVYSRPIMGSYMPPEVIQACILRQLQADAAKVVPGRFQTVITVPAYFDETRRRATAEAGQMAGLDVLDIVNEPTAAALSFGEALGYLTSQGQAKESMRVLVYDLGGGTFDATLLDLSPGQFRTIATDGDVRLGGHDWDARLADYAAAEFIRQHGTDAREHPVTYHKLLIDAEEAKHALTVRTMAKLGIEHFGNKTEVSVTRTQFESMTADLLQRTSHTVRQLLNAAGAKWKDVNRILLVGGSTRMPMVAKMLRQVSGVTAEQKVNPDEAVARGAALYGAYLLGKRGPQPAAANFSVTNVNAHSLGVRGIDQATKIKRNSILIKKNTQLPAAASKKFVTKMANQTSLAIQVLEGESLNPDECITVGQALIRDLPPGLPEGYPVEVTFAYGTNGRLNVRVLVPGTNVEKQLDFVTDRQKFVMSQLPPARPQ